VPRSSHADNPTVDEAPRSAPDGTQQPLTERELDVLRYLPTRLSTIDIAVRLGISPNTVKTHLKNIYKKLDARSRNQAIVKAARLRMISDDSLALLTPLARN
jgi:LuxR family transcriptional regulator, maltose regulon positive regulatory protein